MVPMPFVETNAYDALMCIGVLTHLHNMYKELLEDFCRVVRPGGWLIFSNRTDHYEQYDFGTVLEHYCSSSIMDLVHQSEPRPYLPGHPDYSDKVKVLYFVCCVK